MRIFNFIQQDKKRRFPFRLRRSQNICNLGIRERCRLCDYPLMLYSRCKLIELPFIHMLDNNPRFARFGNNRRG
ncbi:hypothetical protein D3C73_1566830 [compost metagenome]